jgi:hypothetical protein
MKLSVHGTATAVANGEMLDSQGNTAVVRTVVQEWRRKNGGGWEKSAEPLFIDLHTGTPRIAVIISQIVKGDVVMVEGLARCGYDRANRPIVYIEVFEIAVMYNVAERKKSPIGHYDPDLPPTPDDLSKFAPADVGALPTGGM